MQSTTRYLPIAHPWVHSRNAPLYELKFPAAASDDEVRALIGALEDWHTRSFHPFAWVFDLSCISDAPPIQRQMFREHLHKVAEHDAVYHQGVGLVVPNGFVRGLVTAVFWFTSPPYPHEACATRSEAFAWASARLEAGISQPGATVKR